MSKPRIVVTLEREERSALMRWAEIERRTDRNQAAYLIRIALEAAGYLEPATASPPQPAPQEARHAETA